MTQTMETTGNALRGSLLKQPDDNVYGCIQRREAIGANQPVVVVFAALAGIVDQRVGVGDERDDGAIELGGKSVVAKSRARKDPWAAFRFPASLAIVDEVLEI